MNRLQTQVAIVGAGPAGLMLAHLLRAQGIHSVIVEARERDYVEARVRAGVLEQGTVDLLEELGLAQRMRQQALVHEGIELGFNRQRNRIDLQALTGHHVAVYGQHEVVRDLIAAGLAVNMSILFACSGVSVSALDSTRPTVHFTHAGQPCELTCDYIAGCDGFHGICRPSIPQGVLTTYDRVYPFSWLGILAEAPPSQDELVYMHSARGFALFSMRSPTVTRLYLQCSNHIDLADWPDDRVWDELCTRLTSSDGWQPNRGPLLQKSITPMRSYVTEPMQYGRLFLAGDAAHIVPPTGAKGMNLAIADVKVLADALAAFYQRNDALPLAAYSAVCLRRVWKVQRFSWWMTSMLHTMPEASPFDERRQLAELDYVTSSTAAATALAENYVGLPLS